MTTVQQTTSTFAQSLPASAGLVMACEHSMRLSTGAYRSALAFNLMTDVVDLKKHFSEIVITNVRAEVRQDNLIGSESGDVVGTGRVFVAVIPSGKNTDSASGTNGDTVMLVRRKQAFPLSSTAQQNEVFSFDLTGFETDVAQDPRRQQGPVAWIGNTGIVAAVQGENFQFVSVTWYFDCVCAGAAANW